MLENPRRRSGSTRSKSGLSYRHRVYRERDGEWSWALYFKPAGEPWKLVTTGTGANEREATDLCMATQEQDEARRLARRNPEETMQANPYVKVDVDMREMTVGVKRYRLLAYEDSVSGLWTWGVSRNDNGKWTLVDRGTALSQSAARDAAERVAMQGGRVRRNPCHGNPENPCHGNPENPFPNFGHLVHTIGDLPWKKASHPAGFFVWYAPISVKRAQQLVHELVGKRLPRPGYEMNLGELPHEAGLWIENTGGKYILKVL